MSNLMRIFTILCAVIVLVMCAVSFTSCSIGYETNTHEITENIDKLSINVNIADVEIRPSEDGTVKVVCYERPWYRQDVSASDGTLKVDAVHRTTWFRDSLTGKTKVTIYLPEGAYTALDYKGSTGDLTVPGGYTFGSAALEGSTGDTYLNGGIYGNLSVKRSTGHISLDGVICDSLDVSVNTGEITMLSTVCAGDLSAASSTGDKKLEGCQVGGNISLTASTGDLLLNNVTCGGFSSISDTGASAISRLYAGDVYIEETTGKTEISDSEFASLKSVAGTGAISMARVIVSGKLDIERTTGDVSFDGVDFGEAYIKTSTGEVEGTILTDKVIFAESGSGKIDVPKLTSGGRMEIRTTSGSIVLSIGDFG